MAIMVMSRPTFASLPALMRNQKYTSLVQCYAAHESVDRGTRFAPCISVLVQRLTSYHQGHYERSEPLYRLKPRPCHALKSRYQAPLCSIAIQ